MGFTRGGQIGLTGKSGCKFVGVADGYVGGHIDGWEKIVASNNHSGGGMFKKARTGGSGSGGSPGLLAEKCKFDGGTTTCGGLYREEYGFAKGVSEANGTGGGSGDFLGINTSNDPEFFSDERFRGKVGWSSLSVMECGTSLLEFSFGLREQIQNIVNIQSRSELDEKSHVKDVTCEWK